MGTENVNLSYQGLFFLILGAALTFISAGVIELVKNGLNRREKTKNFKLFIKLELQVIAKTLDKLQTGLSYGFYYDYNLLERIKESVGNLDKVRTEAIYLTDAELKEKFVDVLSNILTFVSQTKTTQDLFYQDQKSLNSSGNKTKKGKKQTATEANPQTSSVKNEKEMWEIFNRRTTQRTIEHVEIKRSLEELIEKLK